MSDFNGINYSGHKAGNKAGHGIPTGKKQPTPPPADPLQNAPTLGNSEQQAFQTTSPEHLYNLYAQQSQGVQQSVKMGQMMDNFDKQYDQALKAVNDAFREDFGFDPPQRLLDMMVDRYMNGPSVATGQA